jgi:16S rRNA (guanine966-N2)-methyltransferase
MKLRLISGELGGRLINVPKSDLIRPTTDRTRETLFNILNNLIDFEEINVLDVYAGSGSLGLECISRGAALAHFVEKNSLIYKNLIRNIESLGVSGRCTAFRATTVDFSRNAPLTKYDLILADPPFFMDDIYEVIKNFLLNNFIEEQGIIIVERSIQTKEKDMLNMKAEPFKTIGDTCLYKLYSSHQI